MKVEWSHLFLNMSLKLELMVFVDGLDNGMREKKRSQRGRKALRHSWCLLGTPLRPLPFGAGRSINWKPRLVLSVSCQKPSRGFPLSSSLDFWHDPSRPYVTKPLIISATFSHLPPPYILFPTRDESHVLRPSCSVSWASHLSSLPLLIRDLHFRSACCLDFLHLFFLVARLFSCMFSRYVFLITACIYPIIVFPILYSL